MFSPETPLLPDISTVSRLTTGSKLITGELMEKDELAMVAEYPPPSSIITPNPEETILEIGVCSPAMQNWRNDEKKNCFDLQGMKKTVNESNHGWRQCLSMNHQTQSRWCFNHAKS